eukprot:c25852_g1_i1.p1 GENE.c25852_g1_i1~~c25852_g1_i1.p1  ORF type:complete len:511 (-),score=118.18 c25852_g1_i1:278-1810(-)
MAYVTQRMSHCISRVYHSKHLELLRCFWSSTLTIFGMVVLTAATVSKQNLFWVSVPWWVQILLLVFDMLLLGTLEGAQIALVALKDHNSEAFKHSHPRAYATNKLVQKPGNLERFLVGRQMLVVMAVFFGSFITTQSTDFSTLLGWSFPSWVGVAFFQTGFMGVLVVAVFGQLMVQVVASSFPINFLETNPFAFPVLWGCLLFEAIGFVHLSYPVADVFMRLAGLKYLDDNAVKPLKLKRKGFSHLFSLQPHPSPYSLRVVSTRTRKTFAISIASNANTLLTRSPSMSSNENIANGNTVCDVVDVVPGGGGDNHDWIAAAPVSSPVGNDNKNSKQRHSGCNSNGKCKSKSSSNSSNSSALQTNYNSHNRELCESLVDVVSTLVKTNPHDTEVMRDAMQKYPQLFNNFPTLVGGKVYCSPQQTAAYLRDRGLGSRNTPRFLLPTSDDSHIPPHVYVCQLLAVQNRLREKLRMCGVTECVSVPGIKAYGTHAESQLLTAVASMEHVPTTILS